jgi:hypothetical protein
MSSRSKPPLNGKIVLLVGGQLSESDGVVSESHHFEMQSVDEADVRIEEAIIALAKAHPRASEPPSPSHSLQKAHL